MNWTGGGVPLQKRRACIRQQKVHKRQMEFLTGANKLIVTGGGVSSGDPIKEIQVKLFGRQVQQQVQHDDSCTVGCASSIDILKLNNIGAGANDQRVNGESSECVDPSSEIDVVQLIDNEINDSVCPMLGEEQDSRSSSIGQKQERMEFAQLKGRVMRLEALTASLNHKIHTLLAKRK